jgi:hypothetical protein
MSWRKIHSEELSFTAHHTECYCGYEMNTIGKCKAKKSQDAEGSVILKPIFKRQQCREEQTDLI